MERITLSSFGRQSISAGLLVPRTGARVADKWSVLRDLGAARKAFGVTDRDLSVLSALLSFLPGSEVTDESPTIVYASNESLRARAHGMAESTLRRHLGALVVAGLLHRHDSPNGKRYALRGAGGVETAFGLDLSPLASRADEIATAAQSAREAEALARRHRMRAVLAMRDAEAFLGAGPCPIATARLVALKRMLRRKLNVDAATALADEALRLLSDVKPTETAQSSGSAAHFGRHYQNSEKEYLDSEPCVEQQKAQATDPTPEVAPALPLYLVTKAAPDIEIFGNRTVRTWSDLVSAADHVRSMLDISVDAWHTARRAMGDVVAAITLACILQSNDRIRKPGGYLRKLTDQAKRGEFSPGRMVMALLRVDRGLQA